MLKSSKVRGCLIFYTCFQRISHFTLFSSAPNTEKYLDRFPLCFSSFGGALNATVKALDGFNDVYHDETLTLQLYTLEKRFQVDMSLSRTEADPH